MAHVVCLLNVEADRATFTWSEGPASFQPYTLDGMVYKDFQEIAAAAREKLADLVKDYLFDEQAMPKSALALAEAGHELYQAMFQPGAEQARQAKQVRKWLEQLAGQHEVDTLEIVVESPWSLSWNIIYDQVPNKAAFLSGDESPDRWKPFWGLRYNLAGGRKVDPLRRMPLLNDPKVLLVVDPDTRDGLPEQQQKRLAEFVASHKFKMVHGKDELQEAISAERPDLLYWLSHASADSLLLAGEPISPRNMRKLLQQDDDENFGGLAFLNACQTAERGESGSFFEAFHNVGFAGMIGTEHQTVDQFANPLGLDFLEAFLDRGEPVGSVLRKLRGRVPLGLLYGTYCPPDIRVDRGNIQDSLEISQVHVQGVALGAALAADETVTRTLPPLPDQPYRSLAYYDRKDRALLAGRDDDVERFAKYLDDASTRILVLHGESGVGKSSFLHAGVIPYLEEECLGYRFMRDSDADESADVQASVIFIRATNDLFGQLAQALCDFCARPYKYQTPLGEQVSADLPGALAELIGDDVNQGIVRALLRNDPSLLGRMMVAISDCLPFTAILVIDQGEEVFTLAQTPEDLKRGHQALDMLRRAVGAAGDFKVIFSLRTEYYGRVIDRLRRGLQDTGRIREYLLTDFDEDDLLEAIRRPTADEPIPYTSEVPFEKYGFRYAAGVAEEIAHRVVRYTTQRRDSVLPLMQVVCAQLYPLARTRADRTITLADLETLGGIEGGMRNHVEGLLSGLLEGRARDKKSLQRLFTQLYLKQADGTLTTALLAEAEVRKRWTGRMRFDTMLDVCCWLRLLKINNLRIGMEEERRYVSLGHDALAKIAADWDEQLSRGARMRKMAAAIGAISAVAIFMAVIAFWFWELKKDATRQTAKAFFYRATTSRDYQGHAIKAAHNFIRASLAFTAANEESRSQNADLAAQANSQAVIRTFPHGERIVDAAVSEDGKWLVTCTGWDGAAWLWDLKSGRRVKGFSHSTRVDSVTFGTVGDLFLVEGWDHLWIESTKQLKTIREFSFRGGGAFNPDDSKVVLWHDPVVSEAFRLMIWEVRALEGGSPLWDVEITHKIRGVQFSPDGQRIITWGDDVWLYDAETGHGEPVGHPANGALFLSDDVAATWGKDGIVRIISTDGQTPKKEISLPSAIEHAAIGKTGDILFAEIENGVHRLDIINGTSTVVLKYPSGKNWITRFDRDGRHVVIWGGTQAQVWNTETRTLELVCRHDGDVTAALFCNEDRYVLTCSSDGTARFWDFAANRAASSVEHEGGVIGALFVNDNGTRIVSWGRDKAVRFWGPSEEKSTASTFDGTTAGAVLSNDKSKVATWSSGSVEPLVPSADPFSPPSGLGSDDVSSDKMVRLWDAAKGRVLAELPHDAPVLGAEFDLAGRQVITCSRQSITLWGQLYSGEPIPSSTKINDGLAGCRFSKDLSSAIVWDLGGALWLWRRQTAQVKSLGQKRTNVYDATFDGTGSRLITCHVGWTQLWDVTNGHMIEEYSHGESIAVHSASFSADGSKVLTCSSNRKSRIWSVGTPGSPYRIFSHDRDVSGQSRFFLGGTFDSTEKRVLTWSDDGTSRLWDVASGQLLRVFRVESPNDQAGETATWLGGIFNATDSRILTWAMDGTIVLWDPEMNEPIRIFRHAGGVVDAHLNSGENRLLTCGKDGIAQLWYLESDHRLPAEDRVLEWEIRSGTEVSSSGEYRVLSYDDWEAKKAKYLSRRR